MGLTFQSAGGGGGGGTPSIVTTPAVQLSDGDFFSKRLRISDGSTAEVTETGVETVTGGLPAGLSTIIRDQTAGVELFSEETRKATGDPLVELAGPAVIEFRSDNQTGASQDVIGGHLVVIE